MNFTILLLNGPNINLLGTREVDKYGHTSLEQIVNDLSNQAACSGIILKHFQSNAEHEIVEKIHKSSDVHYIIINPAALAHTSIALYDALLAVKIPFIEVHISNLYTRESFRHNSYLSKIASGIICGLGTDGYNLALQIAIKRLGNI